MRVACLLTSSSLLLAALSATACGGSPPPAPAAPETPAAEPAAGDAAASNQPGSADEEGWAGESTAKDKDTGAPSEAPADKPVSDEPATTGGKGPETRTMDVIRKIVMDNRKAARKCYEDARQDSKDLQGNVVIHFVLDPEGKVKSADLNQERSTLTSPALVKCVIGVIKGIQFPKSSRGMETTANYPFNFTP